MTRVAVIGGGQIGEALIRGLLESGWTGADVVVVGRSPDRVAALGQRLGVRATADAAEAARTSDLIVVAVKPGDIDGVLSGLDAAHMGAGHDRVLVSLVAGVSIAQLDRGLPPGTPTVRAMPNTPMLVRQGITALAANRHVSTEQLGRVIRMLSTVGKVVVVDESDLDAVTAVSGSGPAYFFAIAEAMVEAAVHLGLPHPVAVRSVTQTMLGSAALLQSSPRSAPELRAAATSPAGTTAAALRELERRGLRSTLHDALAAARQRSMEYGTTA
ncbi:pyrroline-5-carboxylate reductase [Nocardia sp. NPDC005978]|uniref:pyrroline-5-carboxylate reductase n=1 Tax=Nocardia sp. NPDC005978 TaxID=3156725 RepID=UPI00339F0CF7